MFFRTMTASLALLIGFAASQTWAQPEPAQVAETSATPASAPPAMEPEPEMEIDKTTPSEAKGETAKQRARRYIQDKGWQRGENTKKDGNVFVVNIGTGTNSMPASDPGWQGGRVFAFDEALLMAKKTIAKTISTEISRSLKRDYQANLGNARKNKEVEAANAAPSIPDDLVGKTRLLLKAKLDQALAQEGIEPDSPEAPAAVERLLREKSMEKAITALAQTRLSGIQVAKVFESKGEENRGQFAVVAIQSEKLTRMADALASENYSSIPPGKPKKRIADQIPKDPKVLFASFGVQQMRDENGRFVLVSYGQSFPFIEDDQDELEAAYDSAELEANAQIRTFAGEQISVLESKKSAVSLETLVAGQERQQFNEQRKDRIDAISKRLKISGMQRIYEEEMRHPFTGKQIAVAVVTWSPQSGTAARARGKRMEKPVTQAPGQGESGQWGKADHGGSYQAEGAGVDEDDF